MIWPGIFKWCLPGLPAAQVGKTAPRPTEGVQARRSHRRAQQVADAPQIATGKQIAIYLPERIMVKNRACSSGLSKRPVKRLVMVEAPCFCTPRMDMHICSASINTAMP